MRTDWFCCDVATERRRDDALAQRDEARRWCAVLVIVICMTAMALGYVLANVPV